MKTKLIFLFTIFAFALTTNAQWKQANGPYGGISRAILIKGTDIFAGTSGGGVFVSSNNGQTWKPCNKGISNFTVGSLTLNGTTLFAGTDGGGAFMSLDNGANWSVVGGGITNYYVRALAANGSNVFAGTGAGMFVSYNNGNSWTNFSNGLTISDVRAILIKDTLVFAATYGGGIFRSGINANNWVAVNTGITTNYIYSLSYSDSVIYAASSNKGIFTSTCNGNSWSNINSTNNQLLDDWVNYVLAYGTKIFAATYHGMCVSSNKGQTWTTINNGLLNKDIRSLAYNGTLLFAGSNDGGVFVSTNNGNDWNLCGIQNTYATSFTVYGDNVFVGTYGNYSLHVTTDLGVHWIPLANGLLNTYENRAVISVTHVDSILIVGTDGGGVFRSIDFGKTWAPCDSGFSNKYLTCYALLTSNTKIYAATNYGVYTSTDNGITWNSISSGLPTTGIISLGIKGTSIFAGTKGSGFYIYNNTTGSWSAFNVGLTALNVYSICDNNSSIFIGTSNGIFVSTNDGASWSAVATGAPYMYVYALVSSGNMMFAGTNGGTYFSKDNGVTWKYDVTGIDGIASKDTRALAISGTTVFAGMYEGAVWTRPIGNFSGLPNMDSKQYEPQFICYPNPFTDQIRFQLNHQPNFKTLKVVIYDLSGKVMDQKYFAWDDELVFNNVNVTAGLYLCQVLNGDEILGAVKIIKR